VSSPFNARLHSCSLLTSCLLSEICEIRYFPLTNIVTGPDLDRILPLGTILFIREPTFRLEYPHSKRSPLISVNSPTDVVFLRPDHPRLENITWSSPSPAPSPPRPVDLHALGDSLADEGKLQLAAKAYSDGLFTDLDSKEKLVLQLSRAKVQLRLSNFASAVRGAASAIRMIDEGVEGGPGMMSGAVLVMAKGYEGLRLFSKAESSYRRYLQLIPANSPRAKEGKEGQKRMRTNQVDAAVARFIEMNVNELHEAKAWDNGYDLADWFGPIAIARIPGREGGRGIVTTRDVAPGELLMGKFMVSFSSPPRSVEVDFPFLTPSRESLRLWRSSRVPQQPELERTRSRCSLQSVRLWNPPSLEPRYTPMRRSICAVLRQRALRRSSLPISPHSYSQSTCSESFRRRRDSNSTRSRYRSS